MENVLLIVMQSAHLVAQRKSFQQSMEDVLTLSREQTSSQPLIASALEELKVLAQPQLTFSVKTHVYFALLWRQVHVGVPLSDLFSTVTAISYPEYLQHNLKKSHCATIRPDCRSDSQSQSVSHWTSISITFTATIPHVISCMDVVCFVR